MATTSDFRRIIAKSFFDSVRNRLSEDIFFAMTSYSEGAPDLEIIDSDGIDLIESANLATNAITMHRILPGGASRVISRNQWTRNSIYEGWSLSATNYFVFVREFVSGVVQLNVYKCLFSPGTASTIAPSGAPITPFATVDGYWWQYMFTIDNSSAIRFLTADYIPVSERITALDAESISIGTSRYRQYVVQQNAVIGGVYNVEISSGFEHDSLVGDGDTLRIYGYSPARDSDLIVQRFEGTILRIGDDGNTRYVFQLETPGIGYGQQMQIADNLEYDPVMTDGSMGSVVNGVVPAVAPGLGHGTDAPTELAASSVMLVVRNVPSGDFLPLATNSFSVLSLVQNPIDSSTQNIAERDFYVACKSFDIAEGQRQIFQEGDIIVRDVSAAQALVRVVATDGNRVYYTNVGSESVNLFASSTHNYGVQNTSGSGITGATVQIERLNDRQVVYNSHILAVSNVQTVAVNRADDQIESMNFIFDF